MNTIKNNSFYMQKALTEAHKALAKDEVPIGAVVIDRQGKIIGRGHNLVEQTKLQTAHAEIRAITQACRKQKDWRLDGCWIYVTLEPCSMCMNLILLSRFAGLVYGASSPLFGFDLDNQGPLQLYRRNKLQIIKDICSKESAQLLKDFFKKKRNSSE
jgi:tRNA(adenine34) deaminase